MKNRQEHWMIQGSQEYKELFQHIYNINLSDAEATDQFKKLMQLLFIFTEKTLHTNNPQNI